MRHLGLTFAAMALAAALSACNKPSTSSQPEQAATPPSQMTDAEKQKALATLPAPYNTADLANGESKFSRSAPPATPYPKAHPT